MRLIEVWYTALFLYGLFFFVRAGWLIFVPLETAGMESLIQAQRIRERKILVSFLFSLVLTAAGILVVMYSFRT